MENATKVTITLDAPYMGETVWDLDGYLANLRGDTLRDAARELGVKVKSSSKVGDIRSDMRTILATKAAHTVTTTTLTLGNGDTVHHADCTCGYGSAFYAEINDARDVANGHGSVTRPPYVAPAHVADALGASAGDVITNGTVSATVIEIANGMAWIEPRVGHFVGVDIETPGEWTRVPHTVESIMPVVGTTYVTDNNDNVFQVTYADRNWVGYRLNGETGHSMKTVDFMDLIKSGQVGVMQLATPEVSAALMVRIGDMYRTERNNTLTVTDVREGEVSYSVGGLHSHMAEDTFTYLIGDEIIVPVIAGEVPASAGDRSRKFKSTSRARKYRKGA